MQMYIVNLPEEDLIFSVFKTFLTTDPPLLFHSESYKTSVQRDMLQKTLALRTAWSPNPY